MDIRLLRYFIATVEEGSVQAGARRMNVAQPALSRRIRDLELALDCRLLVRGARGVAATRAGRAFYEAAVAIVRQFDSAVHQARRLGLEQEREVRLGLVQTARKYEFLREAVHEFSRKKEFPRIAFSRAPSTALLDALRDGKLDIAFVYEQHVGSPRLEERLIHRERYILAAHPSHALAGKGPLNLWQLAAQPLVWLDRQSSAGGQDLLLQQCRLHGLEPNIAQLASSNEEQIDLVVVSGGACLTPASTMLLTHPGQLIFRPLPDFGMALNLSLGWVKEAGNSPVGAMLRCLHTAIDQHQEQIRQGNVGELALFGECLLDV